MSIRIKCYWCNEYQDMNATVPTCDYYGHFGSCPCKDECEHYISEPEVENIIRKRAETEWIPITKSEPNTADHVFVTYKWGNDDLEVSELDYWIAKSEAEDGNAWCKRLIDHVIAWRPMLEPYREDGEEE